MNNKWFRLLTLGAAAALLAAGAVQQQAEPKPAPKAPAAKPASSDPVVPPGFGPTVRPPASSKSKSSSKQAQKSSEEEKKKKTSSSKRISSSAAAGSTAQASSKSAPKANKITLPPDATPIGANTYAHTDASGKKWIYKTTPFGVHRTEATGQEQAADAGNADAVKVTDAGDQLRFERSTAFGMSSWTKKKTELTAWEKQVWEEQKRGKAPENKND
jgi:hypothetical protein